MLLAAHPSRHGVLTESIDPAIVDESDPDRRDPELDLYGPDAPTPPYDREWLERYRAAQVARNSRITAWVKAQLQHPRSQGRTADERGISVQRTQAHPAAADRRHHP